MMEKLDMANDIANKLKNMCDYTFVNHIQAKLLGTSSINLARIDVFDMIASRIRIRFHIDVIIKDAERDTVYGQKMDQHRR